MPKIYSIDVGGDTVGVVCATDGCNWLYAEDSVSREFGFYTAVDYGRYYPNVEIYFQYIHKKYGNNVPDRLYGVYQFDDQDHEQSRRELHTIYNHFNTHGRMLLIFPTVDQVKEAFGYEKLMPWANFWFCSDWKEGG